MVAFQHFVFLPFDFLAGGTTSINFEGFWNAIFYMWLVNLLLIIPFFFFWYLAAEEEGFVSLKVRKVCHCVCELLFVGCDCYCCGVDFVLVFGI